MYVCNINFKPIAYLPGQPSVGTKRLKVKTVHLRNLLQLRRVPLLQDR